MVSVRLDKELNERLEEAARRSGLSKSEFIREAVREKTAELLPDDDSFAALWARVDAAGAGYSEEPIHSEWGADLLRKHEEDTADFLARLHEQRDVGAG